METLEEEQSTTTTTTTTTTGDDESLPIEIISEIFSRLPIKSILQFKSVSKPWLSRISDPSFTKLHFTRATVDHRTAFFISAFDASTSKQHLLSAAGHGGPITHLMTLDGAYSKATTKAQHLNGLVCFCCDPWPSDFEYLYAPVFVVNPSTRKVFQLPEPDCLLNDDDGVLHLFYLFGFDEYTDDHKILMIRADVKPNSVEVSIFSMSSYSWRKIDAEPPVGFTWDGLRYNTGYSVSVNSVVHMMLDDPLGILAFDLRTEKFSVIKVPQCVMPHQPVPEYYTSSDEDEVNKSGLFEINGCVGVFCYHHVEESKELHIWVLQEYEKRVWVTEIISFPESWIDLHDPFPFSFDVDKDEFIFASSKVSGNVVSVPTFNMKSNCFSSLQFTLSDQFLLSETLEFNQIKRCVESFRPL